MIIILQFEENMITYGDDLKIRLKIDMIREIQEMKDSDHAHHDGMCLVDENGMVY
jgi:hypothetical protein